MINVEKKKSGAWFFKILLVLFLLYISLTIAIEAGYYEAKLSEKTTITEEAMKQFEQDVKDGRTLSKLEQEGKTIEYEELESKVLERAKARQEEFEQIVFKEQREIIKANAGESIYLDLVDMMFDFFANAFVEKRISQMNTLTTNLRKITNK